MHNSETNYKSITCTTACNRLKRAMPYRWDLNVYRGCSHGCRYCFALYTHKYMEDGAADFYSDIYVKGNIVDRLEEQLRSPGWKREVVNLGGTTDNYQPGEADFKLMPDILKLLIKYKTPAIISTKSNLVLRDYDLIDELSRITYINVAASIITVDEDLKRKLEPGSSSVKERFRVLKEFSKTNASTGLHCMPIIPMLTDSYENFDGLFSQARDCQVSYVLPGTMYLRGQTKPAFLEFMYDTFPDKFQDFSLLYKKGGAGKEYKEKLYKTVNFLRDQYKLSSSYSKVMKEKMPDEKMQGTKSRDSIEDGEQLTLF